MNSINNVTMTVNNQETVFNNSIVTNMEELTKKLKKEEKVLQHLAKSKADASVINCQSVKNATRRSRCKRGTG